jgi:hypothetical protein
MRIARKLRTRLRGVIRGEGDVGKEGREAGDRSQKGKRVHGTWNFAFFCKTILCNRLFLLPAVLAT